MLRSGPVPTTPDFTDPPDCAAWLEARRIEREWTQEDLARQLDVSYSAVRGWLKGRYKPDYDMLWRFRELFGSTPFDEA